MKNKIFLGCLAAAALLAASCSDFLDEDPKGKITAGNWPTNEAELAADINTLYAKVQRSQCNSNTMILQCQGDDATSTTGSNKAAYLSADAYEQPADSKGLRDTWACSYDIIRVANDILSYTKPENFSKTVYEQAAGQALYWRAYSYYNLVRLYGPLPLFTGSDEVAKDLAPSSVEDVYKQIVADLELAESYNLPARYSGTGKAIGDANIWVSAQTVKATLAAVYMSMAGYPLNKSEYWAKAADKAKEVVDGVNAGTYPQVLLADYNEVYSYGNNTHAECLLGIDYMHRAGGWGNEDSQISSSHQSDKVGGGWGDFLAERRFWKNFPDGPRKDAVYAKQIRLNNGICVDWWATTDEQPVVWNGVKWVNAAFGDFRPMFVGFTLNDDNGPAAAPYDYTKPFWGGMCIDKRHQLIRYSEVLCWLAEAAGRSGQHVAEGKAALKQVRQRAYADQSKVDEVDAMSNDALAEAAYNEHGWEVAGNVLGMVTRRSDEFRMERMKLNHDYRAGDQADVLVPAGTLTHSYKMVGDKAVAYTYILSADVRAQEEYPVKAAWAGESSIYHDYPPVEKEKNPNLHR